MPEGEKGFQKGNKIGLEHGHCIKGKNTKIYQVWISMRDRCNNPNNKAYKNYGNRGISVCDRWNSFENFLADMGKCPDGFVMDRINNDGNYETSNCRWIDRKTSAINRRGRKLSMEKANEIRRLYSEGYTQREIAKQFNISHPMVSAIINKKAWK